MEEILCILFLLYLAIVWVFLAILFKEWRKEEKGKEKDKHDER